MRVLLTNDDGISSAGLCALVRAFCHSHQVLVAAPATNKSGVSSQINPKSFLCVKKASIEGAKEAFAVEGSPVDCVLFGMSHFDSIDVVVSGINNGANLGTDVIYSGTCGAARQAAFLGVPGIALSVDFDLAEPSGYISCSEESVYFDKLAHFALKNLEQLIALCAKPVLCKRVLSPTQEADGEKYYEFFVNVNAPAAEKYKGARLTYPCVRRYFQDTEREQKGDDAVFSNKGKLVVLSLARAQECASDFEACKSGFVAVSQIYSEPSFPPLDEGVAKEALLDVSF